MDEPESMGEIGLPVREGLDNLVFVINCNLQRLDGPVRGNGKIIQELEAAFQGAGWKVIKVVWGKGWDNLLARDTTGLLRKRMEECVDGDYQNFKSKDGAYVREHFFGKYPELKAMVANMSDAEIWNLHRGGHSRRKVHAAYKEAVETKDRPVVILAKTVKGFGMGAAGEGRMIAHQQKKLGLDDLKAFRDRFDLPISDEDIEQVPFRKPPDDSPEIRYLKERREALGGYLPRRISKAPKLKIPPLEEIFKGQLEGSGDREISTTMAMVRMLTALCRDKGSRQERRADRARRGADLRHGRHVQAIRHLVARGPALHAAGRRHPELLQGRQDRADSADRHRRGRGALRLDGGGHRVRQSRREHDSLLPVLLDVRLPARR
jgi:pyruvate dehydrogenase E1 component